MPENENYKSESEKFSQTVDQAKQSAADDARTQRQALDDQAKQEVSAESDDVDMDFESWFNDASAAAGEQVKETTGKSPDEYTDDTGSVSAEDLGIEDEDWAESPETEKESQEYDTQLNEEESLFDSLNAEVSDDTDTAEEETSSEDSQLDTPVRVAPVNGHFNVLTMGSDYFDRLIAVLVDRREAYVLAAKEYEQQNKDDPEALKQNMYAESAQICADLYTITMASAMRFTDVSGTDAVALTVQDEDMSNLLLIILAATYDPKAEADKNYAADLREYQV